MTLRLLRTSRKPKDHMCESGGDVGRFIKSNATPAAAYASEKDRTLFGADHRVVGRGETVQKDFLEDFDGEAVNGSYERLVLLDVARKFHVLLHKRVIVGFDLVNLAL